MVKQLGKYEILRTLGQGAMGEVYLANHPTIGREVAIKTILPSAARGEDAEGRFRREATAAGKLNHPNLVTIYDFDRDGDILYLVMEYVKGDDLEDLIQDRSLSQSQFLELLAQICDGLSFAHRNGIIHRDIKPANVRVMRDGKRLLAKVMDFGIARIEDSGMTATGIVMGTVSYMAPEYIQSGHASAQCDLWAVGVMLYECLAGYKPFYAENTTTILFKIVTESPKPLEASVVQGVSPSIRNVMERALAKDPAQRFQTADDFAKALRACKDPSFIGSIEDAVARTSSVKAGTQVEPSPDAGNGTVMLENSPSRMMSAPSAPTVVGGASSGSAPTVVAPLSHAEVAAPTAVMQSQPLVAPVPPAAAPVTPPKSGGKGLFIAAGVVGLLAVGGGAFWVLKGKKADSSATGAAAQPTPTGVLPSAGPMATASAQNTVPSTPGIQPTGKPTTAPGQIVSTQPAPTTKSEPTKTEAPKPVEDTPAQKLEKAVALIGSNPNQAVASLRGLAAAQPGDPAISGNLLAALYRTRNVSEFERVLDGAKARGLNGTVLMKAAPAFRQAMMEEREALKAKSGANLLSPALILKALS